MPKMAKVLTARWQGVVVDLAQECLHWRDKNGKPDAYHLVGAAHTYGYEEIDDDNLDEVYGFLRGYGLAAEKYKAEKKSRKTKEYVPSEKAVAAIMGESDQPDSGAGGSADEDPIDQPDPGKIFWPEDSDDPLR